MSKPTKYSAYACGPNSGTTKPHLLFARGRWRMIVSDNTNSNMLAVKYAELENRYKVDRYTTQKQHNANRIHRHWAMRTTPLLEIKR